MSESANQEGEILLAVADDGGDGGEGSDEEAARREAEERVEEAKVEGSSDEKEAPRDLDSGEVRKVALQIFNQCVPLRAGDMGMKKKYKQD